MNFYIFIYYILEGHLTEMIMTLLGSITMTNVTMHVCFYAKTTHSYTILVTVVSCYGHLL